MLRQFIRLIINRNFSKNIFLTVLNVFGLAVGLTAFILIMLFVRHERNYDTFHRHYDDIYRIISGKKEFTHSGSPAQLAPLLRKKLPEIRDYVRMEERADITVYHNRELFFENDLLYADSSLFTVFDFEITQGDARSPLRDPNSLVITERMAGKFFGDQDPIGKTLRLFQDRKPFTVSAVTSNPPSNSTIRFNFILPFELMERGSQWGMFNYTTFLLLDHKQENEISNKIRDLSVDRGDRLMQLNFIRLQPLEDMRFEPVRGNTFPTIDRRYIFIYLSAAVFVLLLAAINYTNLASAISVKRSKEVALKKIAGSSRRRIILEVLVESVLLSLLALFLAVVFVEMARPLFVRSVQAEMVFSYSDLPLYLLVAVVVGFLAGLYPAFYSSGFGIMTLLKETLYKGRKGSAFRNALVLIQFGITSFLLICALSFSQQLKYLNQQDLGLQVENVYSLDVHWSGIKLDRLKQALKDAPEIEGVTTSSFGAGVVNWNQTAYWPGSTEEERINMYVHLVDRHFFETLKIEILDGRDKYSQLKRKDRSLYVINASASDYLGWDRATGKEFSVYGDTKYGEIAGVSADFKFRSLHHKVEPSAFVLRDEAVQDRMHIRVMGGQTPQALDLIRKEWDQYAPPNAPYLLSSLEEDFENLYAAEQRTRRIVSYFTVVALIISFLGLTGLAAYISLQRTKEIGIRKVIGATRKGLAGMLLGSFIKWVVIAFLIASPLAYLYVNHWLQNFAYHMDISLWVFLLAGIFALGVGVLSVIIQVWRASGTNPVNALRYE